MQSLLHNFLPARADIPRRVGSLALVVATMVSQAATNDFLCQKFTLPTTARLARFADIDQDGRADLLAPDPSRKALLIYRQRPAGFPDSPDQALELPPRTAWIAPYDADPHPGLELVVSTATGLLYYRQNRGVFESEPRVLVEARQVFTNDDAALLVLLRTNNAIPVISSAEVVPYERTDAFAWSSRPPQALHAKRAHWEVFPEQWSLEGHSSHNMFIQQSWLAKPDETGTDKPEHEAILKLYGQLKRKGGTLHEPGLDQLDVNGDSLEDVVLWQVFGDVDPRTDVYIFLRGADGRLPERPSQVLRGRGIPIPLGDTVRASPLGHLRGDRAFQLVLLDLKSKFTSVSTLVEVAFSKGLDWTLTIRSFQNGAFARLPEANIPITTIIPVLELEQWPFFICGDFNGDGRPDLVVRRSSSEWNIQFSANDDRWFESQPAMSFETPMSGYFEMSDLNGDGRSDIVLRDLDGPRLAVFLTRSPPRKGSN